MAKKPENTTTEVARGAGGKWVKGKSGNPGGKPKKLAEIEAMLESEHRNVTNLREVMATLRTVAMGVPKGVYYKGDRVDEEIQYDAAFMALYLNRVLGPVKEPLEEEDLRDAPDVVIEWLRVRLGR